MTDRIATMREKLINTRPSLTSERLLLATEAYQKYAGEAVMIFRAHVFAYVLEHMTVVIRPEDLLAGSTNKTPRGASIFPEYTGQWLAKDNAIDRLPTRENDPMDVAPEEREKILECLKWWEGRSLEEQCDSVIPSLAMEGRAEGMIAIGCRSLPSGKTVPDFALMFRRGLSGYIKMCQEKIDNCTERTIETQPHIDFWEASIIACRATIQLANRYGEECQRLATECQQPERKAELEEMARICRKVPEHPPESFYEAVQFEWFIYHLLYVDNNCSACGFGRFDLNVGSYYDKDLAEGKISKEFALELIECLFIKSTEIVQVRPDDYSRDFAGYPLWQILMLGGVDRQGNDVTNAITYLSLQAASEVKLAQPAVALRVHEGTPQELWRASCLMIQDGQANPAFFGDQCAIKTVMNKGSNLEDARDWYVLGCVEPHQGGGNTDANPSAGYLNLPKCLELALHNGVDPLTGRQLGPQTGKLTDFTTYDQLLKAVKTQIAYWYDLVHQGFNAVISKHSTMLPCIYSSFMIEGCIEKGKPVQHGGAQNTYTGIFCAGAASLADSLSGVKKFVFDDLTVSLTELVEALDDNFQKNPRLRLDLLHKAPKFGNDDLYVDSICDDLVEYIAGYVQEFTDARGGKYCFCNQAQTVSVTMGLKVGATPDGRFAYTPLSDNGGPAMGCDVNGPTASVNSMGKNMHQENVHDGTLMNLRFDPTGVSGEKGLTIIQNVVQEYVENDGLHIQINVVDDKTLLAAQEDPENYRNIVVRVAGYMAYFTELDKAVQDNIIARTTHLA